MKIDWKRLRRWAERQAQKPIAREYLMRKAREWWRKRRRR